MLFADTNDILAIVHDFGIGADGAVAEGVAWAKSDRFDDTFTRAKQAPDGSSVGEARAIVNNDSSVYEVNHFLSQFVATDTLNVHPITPFSRHTGQIL